MDYLYHGSSGYFKKLIPRQAYDIGFEEGCKKAVYATSNKNMALAFALGAVPNKNGEIERVMMPEFGDIMVYEKGTPNYGGKGYLYVLDKKKFQHAMGSQWVCFEEIEPIEIHEIDVDDYLYLCLVKEKEGEIIGGK